ncbi:unnamed protein product [Pieris macdunnoughi]|uniref:HTH psq-type domain-containing protein n=1 Tax=Pieris macdunnoughi TaxID=345717 RepID=A0A821UGN5_9NEOP|nr:unnamed protein product [Pieris macdunnoughi]
MPRNYLRKASDRCVVTDEQLEAAKLLKGASKRKAAFQVGLKESTLRKRLKTGKTANSLVRFSLTFTKDQETDIYKYIKQSDDLYYGLTMQKLQKLIYEYAEVNKISWPRLGRLEVKALNDGDLFLDFKNWWPRYYTKTAISEETKGRGVIRSLSENKIYFQPTVFKEFRHLIKRAGIIQALIAQRVRLPCEKAYETVNPINAKKIQDIKKLISYIRDTHQDFYKKILTWPTTQARI